MNHSEWWWVMKEKIKDWLFLVTAIAFGIYLSKWFMVLTSLFLMRTARAIY